MCVVVLESLQEAKRKAILWDLTFKKEAILGLTVRAKITVKLGHFIVDD